MCVCVDSIATRSVSSWRRGGKGGPDRTQQQYMILVSHCGNTLRPFIRPSSVERTQVKGTISVYYVLWDPITHSTH